MTTTTTAAARRGRARHAAASERKPDISGAQYLYGVIRDTAPVEQLPPGVHGHPVELLTHGDLTAVVSPIDAGAPVGRRRDLAAHHEVLRQLAAAVDVAPMRFGLILPSAELVRDEILGLRRDALHDVIDRVAGAVQLSVRATYDDDVVLREVVEANDEVRRLREVTQGLPPGQPHRDLLRLGELVAREVERRRLRDRDLLLEQLTPLVVLYHERDLGGAQPVLDAALLVERRSVPRLEGALEALAETLHPRIRLRLTEPTAAFDFVEEPQWA